MLDENLKDENCFISENNSVDVCKFLWNSYEERIY